MDRRDSSISPATTSLDIAVLTDVIAAASESILVLNSDDVVLFANSSAERLFQKSKEQLIAVPLKKLLAEKDGSDDKHKVAFRRVALAKNAGSILYFGSAQEDGDAAAIRLQLEETQQRYELAVDGAMDGIWDLNMETNEVYFSKPFFEGLGFAYNELPGTLKTFYSLCHPDDIVKVELAVREHIINKTPFADVEFRLRHKTGNYLWFLGRGTALRDKNGRAYRFAGSNREISAQKLAEEKLRESETKFRTLAENINAIFWISSADGSKFHYISPAVETIAGIKPQKIYDDANSFFEALHEDDRASARVNMLKDKCESQYRVVLPSGQVRWISVRSFRVDNNDDSYVTYCGVAYDVNMKREAEKRVTEFYSVISHELRTPLTSVRGALGLLDGGVVSWDSDTAKEMVKLSIESTDRLIRLINDIIELKKLESNQVKLKLRPIEPSTLVANAKTAMAVFSQHYKLDLQFNAAPNHLVMADEERIVQVLINLLSNAMKFSSAGSTITVSTIDKGKLMKIAVQDQGMGIAKNEQDKLFTKFQQIDSSDTREKGGTGLGLAMVKAIVDLHGGTVGVESEYGSGSTFWFELPMIEA